MDIKFSQILMWVSMYSVLLPIPILLYRWKELDRVKKVLGIYIVVRIITEFLANYLALGVEIGINNRPLLHIYTIIEFGLLIYLLGSNLRSIIRYRTIQWMIGSMAVIGILNGCFGEGFLHFNAYFRAFEGLTLISLTLLYFYKLLQELKVEHLDREPLFWASLGVLLYFSGSLFLFLISNILDQGRMNSLSMTIWGIHATLNVLLNIFLTLALWVKQRK